MKIVITKALPESTLKAGEHHDLDAVKANAMIDGGFAVSHREWEFEQRAVAAEKRENGRIEAAVGEFLTSAVTAGRFLPKENTDEVKATALAIAKAGAIGAAERYIKSFPVKAKDLTQRTTEGGEPTDDGNSPDLRVGAQSVRQNVKDYIKLSEHFGVTPTNGGGIVRAARGDEKGMKDAMGFARSRALCLQAIDEARIKGENFRMEDMVKAADYADPAASNPLGVLNTGLMLQWNLGFLSNQLAPIGDVTTDISSTPALLNQVLRTRYITVPGVQAKTNTVAWRGTTGNTTDVNVTINNYVGIPITLGEVLQGSTIRNLHMEQKTPQMYGLGEYILHKIIRTYFDGSTRIANDGVATSTITLQGKGDGQTAGTAFVPAGNKWDLTAFTAGLPLAMDLSKFPGGDEGPGTPLQRFAWVHSSIYAGIASDPNLILTQTLQSAIANRTPDLVSTGMLPQLGNIKIRKSQLMTDTVGTSSDGGSPAILTVTPGNYNAATYLGIGGTRSSMLFVSRPPLDYTKVLPEIPSTAAIELAVEPNTGLTFVVVKHLDHAYEYSNLRVAIMFGTALGDERQAFFLHK